LPELTNLFAALPRSTAEGAAIPEQFDELLRTPSLRIERIVSTGQCSPPDFWYDQPEGEWVLVLQGEARLRFAEEAEPRLLKAGDCLNIPAHCRHRVDWTAPDQATVWLAVFYTP
jgi:cupin 2 domain-containing protein